MSNSAALAESIVESGIQATIDHTHQTIIKPMVFSISSATDFENFTSNPSSKYGQIWASFH
ncbi:MAG: hypothetical protein EOP04_24615 [Proteobacteria bacterium]|nr:MAG: hypothetical protein EOP04_24615 [Pseudomonadota bacterium]